MKLNFRRRRKLGGAKEERRAAGSGEKGVEIGQRRGKGVDSCGKSYEFEFGGGKERMSGQRNVDSTKIEKTGSKSISIRPKSIRGIW